MIVVVIPSLQSGGTEWQTYFLLKALLSRHRICLWVYDRRNADQPLYKQFAALSGLQIVSGIGLRQIFSLVRLRPRIILSYAINYYLPEILLAGLTRAVLVTERRNQYHWLKHQKRRKIQENLRNLMTRAVICNSRAVADKVAQMERFVSGKLHVIYNSINPFGADPAAPKNALVVACNIKPGKGVEQILKIFESLEPLAAESGVEFAVYGRLDDPSLLQGRDRALIERVYKGEATREEIFANAFCLVHLSEAEGFPNAVLEAASADMALVLSGIPVHREIFAGAALFVDDYPQALEAVRQMIVWCAAAPDKLFEQSENSRRLAAGFTLNRRVAAYEKLFDACRD